MTDEHLMDANNERKGNGKYNLLKAASWYTIGNVLIKGVAFFVLPMFTSLMSTHEYGVYSVYSSYLSIFEVITLLGLSATVNIAKYADEVDFESYMSTIIVVPFVLSIICAVVLNIYMAISGPVLSMGADLWNCIFISASCGAASNIIAARLIIEGRYIAFMGYSGLYTILNIGLSLAFCLTIYASHDTHLARVYGGTVAAISSMLFLLVVTRTRCRPDAANLSYAFVWGIPLLFHTLATVVLTQSDRILIRYMDSYSSTGIYAVATTISTIPMVLQSSLSQAWTPWFYEKLDGKDYSRIRWLDNRYILGYGLIIAAFMLVSPEIIHLFTAQDYWDSIYCLLPLSISVFGEMIYSIPASVEYYHKRTSYIMAATMITVVVNILLDVIFILLFGYPGAAYATAISKLVLFFMHYFFSKKVDSNALFNKAAVAASLAGLALINILVASFTNLWMARYFILLCLAAASGTYAFRMKDAIISYARK